MYKELEKYATGKIIPGVGILQDRQEIKINLAQYDFYLGDLMEDFIKHQTKPFWKRKYYHEHLSKLYKQVLNKIELTHGF
jgi:hypothetical protein